MFWNNFVNLCNKINKSPNGVCAELGYSTAIATKWKNGSVPRDTTLKKIADYFGVDVSALKEPLLDEKTILTSPANEKESRVLIAYRTKPEMQPAVDKLLGVTDEEELVSVYTAAKSTDNHPPKIIQMSRKEWETLSNAPETDDPLL